MADGARKVGASHRPTARSGRLDEVMNDLIGMFVLRTAEHGR
jgi:hypothetical protein